METPRTYPLTTVDVFAEARLAGNQLAVVESAHTLSDAEMQAIAREMNYAETTFVLGREATRATVRIFTPAWELPFAGHPTLGTAWVLTRGESAITLDLPVGPVEVTFEDGVAWMTPPEVAFHGSLAAGTAAELAGLSEDAFATDLPIELAEVGPKFVLLPLRDLAALRAAKLNGDLHAQLRAEGVGVQCVFLFTEDAYGEDADFASRMFFESAGLREDAATGSANTAFAAYLRKHRGNLGRVVVDQGVEILRPSRLYLDVGDPLRVGGRVVPVVEGTLTV